MKADKQAHKQRLFVKSVVAVVCVAICVMSFSVAAANSYNVTIIDGENTITHTTRASDPLEILKQAGVEFGGEDAVNTDEFVSGEDSVLIVNRHSNVTLVYNGVRTSYTYCGTVQDLLDLAGIMVDEHVSVNASLDAVLYDGMTIDVEETFTVTVKADGKEKKVQTIPAAVRDILEATGVKTGKKDTVTPSLDTVLAKDAVIEVKRAAETEKAKTASVKKTESKKAVNTAVKTTVSAKKDSVTSAAEASTVKETTEAVNPSPIKVTNSKVISQLEVPAKVQIQNNKPVSYKSMMVGKATAYAGDTQTSTGRTPRPGIVAVDPREIPYGTEMWITSADGSIIYGYAIAGDTGGFIYTTDIAVDLFMNTEQECINWGVRSVNIYFL